MAAVQSDRPLDVMKKIQRQCKFQFSNNERFKELAIMKLKEPEEAWSPFEFDEWFEDIKHAVAPLRLNLCDWILQQANTVQRTFVKKEERIKEDEPRLQLRHRKRERKDNSMRLRSLLLRRWKEGDSEGVS